MTPRRAARVKAIEHTQPSYETPTVNPHPGIIRECVKCGVVLVWPRRIYCEDCEKEYIANGYQWPARAE